MKYKSISNHLRPYSISQRRKSTLNHAFAASVASFGKYNDGLIREAIIVLGQNPDDDLTCAYCGVVAETWDHVLATVEKGEYSGHGHSLGNLLPCCKDCNSKKGGKEWKAFLASRNLPQSEITLRIERIERYLSSFSSPKKEVGDIPEYRKLMEIRRHILDKMVEADKLAEVVRRKLYED